LQAQVLHVAEACFGVLWRPSTCVVSSVNEYLYTVHALGVWIC